MNISVNKFLKNNNISSDKSACIIKIIKNEWNYNVEMVNGQSMRCGMLCKKRRFSGFLLMMYIDGSKKDSPIEIENVCRWCVEVLIKKER